MPSDLQVSNIKDLTGSNTGLSIASDGQVTISQNNPTLTLGSNATFPAGHIINTETAEFSTQTSHTADDWETIFSLNITPKYNNSKILVSFYCTIFLERTGSNGGNLGYGFRIQRTAPTSNGFVGQAQSIGGGYYYAASYLSATHQLVNNNGGSAIDTPNTTSQVTYAMQVDDTYCSTLYSQYGGNKSHLIAQEIKV